MHLKPQTTKGDGRRRSPSFNFWEAIATSDTEGRDRRLKAFLEGLYFAYSRRELISPDPLEFLEPYDLPDREVVALVTSSLAYDRVGREIGRASCRERV